MVYELLFCSYHVHHKAQDYGYDDYGYEVCCGFVEGYFPLGFSVGLNGYYLVEGCAPYVCGFNVE